MGESGNAATRADLLWPQRVLTLVWFTCAPLLALGAFARAELSRVPAPVFDLAAGSGELAAAHASALTWAYGFDQLVALWALGALVVAVQGGWMPRRAGQVAVVLPLGFAIWSAFTTLLSDPAIAWRPLVCGSYALALLGAWGVAAAMLQPAGVGPRPQLIGWVRRLATPLAGALAAFGWAMNYKLLPRLYAPVHLSAAQLSLLLGGLALVCLPLVRDKISAWFLGPAVLVAMPIAFTTVSSMRAGNIDDAQVVHRYTNARTSMGQGRVVFGAGAELDEADGAADMPRTRAMQIFDARSGMPKLPEDFDLEGFNVLLVTIEATRFDTTSFGDPTLESTPNMRRFVRGGAKLFTRAYAPSSTTLQSMSAIHSMSYPSAVPLTLWRQPWSGQLRPETQTVAEVMSQVGYDTWWVGHNHNGYFGKRIIGLDQGFESVELVDHQSAGDTARLADKKIADKAIAQINASVEGDKRFFGWVFLVSPHASYVTHDASRPHDTPMERYLQEIHNADAQLGRVIDRLEALGVYENTVVILTADHGEQFKEHGGVKHSSGVFEELVHVPLIVRIPGLSGERYDTPTSLVHLFAWLLNTSPGPMGELALANIRRTLAPVLEATAGGVVVELLGKELHLTGLVYADEKVIHNRSYDVSEVYDLQADPAEHDDRSLRDPSFAARMDDAIQAYTAVRTNIELTRYKAKKKDWLAADQAELEAFDHKAEAN